MDKTLKAQYETLVRNYNAAMSALADAQNQMTEEVSAEGFASKKTKDAVKAYQAEVDDADFELYVFKQENKAFMAELKEAKAQAAAEAAEKFWNQ
jgi:predicted methyltransferase MtxX (methanogen marker protein 4)